MRTIIPKTTAIIIITSSIDIVKSIILSDFGAFSLCIGSGS